MGLANSHEDRWLFHICRVIFLEVCLSNLVNVLWTWHTLMNYAFNTLEPHVEMTHVMCVLFKCHMLQHWSPHIVLCDVGLLGDSHFLEFEA